MKLHQVFLQFTGCNKNNQNIDVIVTLIQPLHLGINESYRKAFQYHWSSHFAVPFVLYPFRSTHYSSPLGLSPFRYNNGLLKWLFCFGLLFK